MCPCTLLSPPWVVPAQGTRRLHPSSSEASTPGLLGRGAWQTLLTKKERPTETQPDQMQTGLARDTSENVSCCSSCVSMKHFPRRDLSLCFPALSTDKRQAGQWTWTASQLLAPSSAHLPGDARRQIRLQDHLQKRIGFLCAR